jgi:hypothetical protein
VTPVRALAAAILVAASGATTAAALMPVRFDSREAVFEIPRGTWARRMAGEDVAILPAQVRLTVGLQDVLVLRNRDEVPQTFGPTVLMPGQSFSLPFAVASTYSFACTAHASGQMTVVVEPRPDSPWQRLRWRWRAWTGAA